MPSPFSHLYVNHHFMHGPWGTYTYYDVELLHGLILDIKNQAPGNKPAASELFVSFGFGNVSSMLYWTGVFESVARTFLAESSPENGPSGKLPDKSLKPCFNASSIVRTTLPLNLARSSCGVS